MARDFGGGASDDALAPVIPLFGRKGGRQADDDVAETAHDADVRDFASSRHPATSSSAVKHDDTSPSSSPSGVARLRALPALGEPDHSSDGSPVGSGEDRGGIDVRDAGTDEIGSDDEEVRAAAIAVLVRKLSAKQLSVSEARDVLRTQGLTGSDAIDVLDDFEERGYLNDLALAEVLVTSGAERRGQGRVAIGRTLAQRGIPRHIADEALGVLEDDDAERALEFARSKAPSMARLDDDAALRRLVGQLSRRGYGGSVAMTAARTALRENKRGFASRPTSVHFTPSDDDDLA